GWPRTHRSDAAYHGESEGPPEQFAGGASARSHVFTRASVALLSSESNCLLSSSNENADSVQPKGVAIPGCDCNANCAYLLPHATCTPAAWYPPLNAICAV